MQNPNFYVVPQEEVGAPKFESIEYMRPQDVMVAKELTMKLGEIFPDGFTRDNGTGVPGEESSDEKIVDTIFTADEVKARFKEVPPEEYMERYYAVQAKADALRNNPNPDVADKALKTDAALKQMDLFLNSYENPKPEQEYPMYGGNYTYMRSLYDSVVQPGLLMVGRKEANVEKLISDMAAVEAKHSTKKPTATSLRDAFSQIGDVPPERVLDYNNRRIRQLS